MKTILHIINKSSIRCYTVSQLQTLTSSQDGIIFIQDGIYNVVNTDTNRTIMAMLGGKVYVLLPDLQARGYDKSDIMVNIVTVDYEQFVDLALDYELSRSW